MKAGSGKQKGSAFERKVCKDLSFWVSGGKRADLFWRSAMSGGRATVHLKKKDKTLAHVAGDICAVHPEGEVLTRRLFIECKHYKDLTFFGYLLNGSGPIAGFWSKTTEQATTFNKIPFLVLKQNLIPTLVMMDLGQANNLFPSLLGDAITFRGCVFLKLDAILTHPLPFRKVLIS